MFDLQFPTIIQSTAPLSFSESPAIGPKTNRSSISSPGIALVKFELNPKEAKVVITEDV